MNYSERSRGGQFAYRAKVERCPACGKRKKAAAIRRDGYEFPIITCVSTKCRLHSSHGSPERLSLGKEYAEEYPTIPGVLGPRKEAATAAQSYSDPFAETRYIIYLAWKARHDHKVQRYSTGDLIQWARGQCRYAVSELFDALFLSEFLTFEEPSYSQESLFASAFEAFKTGEFAGKDENYRLVACVFQCMALYCGQQRPVSVSGYAIQKHYAELGIQIDFRKAYAAIREMVRDGIILEVKPKRHNETDEQHQRRVGYQFGSSDPANNYCRSFLWMGPLPQVGAESLLGNLIESLKSSFENVIVFVRLRACKIYQGLKREACGSRSKEARETQVARSCSEVMPARQTALIGSDRDRSYLDDSF